MHVVLAVLVGSGCATAPSDSAESVPPFLELQVEIFRPACGSGGCHEIGAGSLLLDGSQADHGRLVDAPAVGMPGAVLVVPGDLGSSYLYDKLVDTEEIMGNPMPPAEALVPARVDRIRRWIEGGAPL